MQQILIIDDSESIHTLVKSLLGDEPVTIESAFNPEFGLTMAASLRPDLILLDVDMPGIDGYETCRRLRANPETASFPIIFLTAKAKTEDMVHGLNLGACDYVIKPFKLSELLSRVRAALRTSHMIRLLEEVALIDSLTGVGNAAMFEERLVAEVALRVRCGNHLACIAIDVNNIKRINEVYGQNVGEYVLNKVAETLNAHCRVEDVPCRFSYDQFVVLTPQTSAGDAAILAEKMLAAISELHFAQRDQTFKAACSFGVAQALHTFDRSVRERAAAAAAASAKAGGNRVTVDATMVDQQLAAAAA